jgi:hypothetical protein
VSLPRALAAHSKKKSRTLISTHAHSHQSDPLIVVAPFIHTFPRFLSLPANSKVGVAGRGAPDIAFLTSRAQCPHAH